LAHLKDWIEKHRVDDFPEYLSRVVDGAVYEYVHVTRNGGRRVYIDHPPEKGEDSEASPERSGQSFGPTATIYGRLVGQFEAIRNADR